MKTFTYLLSLSIAIYVSAPEVFAQTEMVEGRQIITPKNYEVSISNLGETVNSSDHDFAPLILGNGRVIFFTSTREGDQNLYSSASTPDGWGTPTNVGNIINTGGEDGGCSITPDGHWMIFTACDREDGHGDCDLYIAEYAGGLWRNARNLGPSINAMEWDSQPSISVDGLTLYFVSERPGGYGGTDIWMTTRSYGGEWGPPMNLGPTVNTAGDDMSPFIAADNSTLYFASNGHPGMGGYDIYKTTRSQNSWSAPDNLGTPINSAYDDYFYSLQLGTDNVFFASDRPGGNGDLDLFVGVPNPLPPSAVTTVVGMVSDSKNRTPVGASLTVRDITSNSIISSFRSDDVDGNYVVVLQPGKKYVITAEAEGYLFYSDRFDVPANSPNNTVRKDITMTRDIVRLLVYFEFDKSVLQPESYVDLDRAVEWMNANPNMRVELAGHTDNVGSRDYNKKLSTDRARSVMNYLVAKGIPSSRLTAVGYGMESPIATNETEEGRAQNRRVEFRVKSN